MPDTIAMTVLVGRELLALAPLNINDGLLYRCSPQFLGATVTWERQQIGSPYIDGSVTVSRRRATVQEQVGVEVKGRTSSSPAMSNPQLKLNMDALVNAFLQDSYTLSVTIDGALYKYQGEAADYQLLWVGTRFMAKQGQVILTMPRRPVALAGTV